MIKEIVSRKWVDKGRNFEYAFAPIEETIIVKDTKDGGFAVGYLAQDEICQSPEEWGDNNLFLVNYHRDFEVTKDEIVTKDQVVDWYRDNIPIAGYWVFPLTMLSHSGVWLKLGTQGFDSDGQGWDTSRVGVVLANKQEFPDKIKAEKSALLLVETWNQCLSGEVYGVIIEFYDSGKNKINEDSFWGCYGFDYAKQELANNMEREGI